jgi:hypothetical protein
MKCSGGTTVALKVLFVTICIGLFIYQMSFIWVQFRDKETSIAMQNVPHADVRLPAATVCARYRIMYKLLKRKLRYFFRVFF